MQSYRSPLCLVLILGWVLVPAASAAQAPPEPEPDPELRTVITPSRGKTTEFDVDRSVYVVDEGALDRASPQDVPDALEDMPGVQIQRTNRGAGVPIIRGLVGPQNLLLVDGLRFNNSTYRIGPNQYAGLVDPSALAGIEVVLGPGSVLYGSDAMGGTVNMLTRPVPGGERFWARADGSFESADLGVDLSLDGGASAGWAGGYAGGSFRHHGTLRAGDGLELPQSDFDDRDWRARFSFDLGEGWTLGTTYLGHETRHAVRLDQVGKGDVRIYDNIDHFAYVDARREADDWLRYLRLALVYHRTEEETDRRTCATGDGGITSDLKLCTALSDLAVDRKRRHDDMVDTVGGLVIGTVSFFDHRLDITLGSETYADFVGSTLDDAKKSDAGFDFESKERGNFSDGSTYLTTGAFLYAEGRPVVIPGTGDLVLSAGVRLAYVEATAPDVPGVGDVSYDDLGVVFSGGARFLLWNHYNFFANFSQGFRSPNLQETTVLGDTGNNFEIPNDDLGPERSNTVEVGMKVHHRWLRLSGAFSYSLITDFIDREDATWEGQTEVDGKAVVRRINAGEAEYLGAEGALEVGPFAGFSVFGSVSWLKGDVTGKDGETVPARRVPPIEGVGGLRYVTLSDRLTVDIYARWAADQDRLHPEDKKDLRICEDRGAPGTLLEPCPGGDGWVTPGIRASYVLSEQILLNASLDNLADTRYRTYGSGIDAPGFNAQVGAVVEF